MHYNNNSSSSSQPVQRKRHLAFFGRVKIVRQRRIVQLTVVEPNVAHVVHRVSTRHVRLERGRVLDAQSVERGGE